MWIAIWLRTVPMLCSAAGRVASTLVNQERQPNARPMHARPMLLPCTLRRCHVVGISPPKLLDSVRECIGSRSKEVLRKDLGSINHVERAKTPIRVPMVMSVDEVRRVLNELSGVPELVAMLLYGADLRLQECVELRVKDIDFDRRELLIRRGKGQKDRRVMLPEAIRDPLLQHLKEVRATHQADLMKGLWSIPTSSRAAAWGQESDRPAVIGVHCEIFAMNTKLGRPEISRKLQARNGLPTR
jgi:hypothetical protein